MLIHIRYLVITADDTILSQLHGSLKVETAAIPQFHAVYVQTSAMFSQIRNSRSDIQETLYRSATGKIFMIRSIMNHNEVSIRSRTTSASSVAWIFCGSQFLYMTAVSVHLLSSSQSSPADVTGCLLRMRVTKLLPATLRSTLGAKLITRVVARCRAG